MMVDCDYCGKAFEARKPDQRFCCPAHRAAWHKDHAGVIPGTVCSSAMARDGALVVVVRVPKEFSAKFARLPPRTHVDLLEDT